MIISTRVGHTWKFRIVLNVKKCMNLYRYSRIFPVTYVISDRNILHVIYLIQYIHFLVIYKKQYATPNCYEERCFIQRDVEVNKSLNVL